MIITKHGKPVAKITRPDRERKPISLEALRHLSSTLPPETESTEETMLDSIPLDEDNDEWTW